MEHFIITSGPPVSSKFHRLDGKKLAAAKAEFAAMEMEGIIQLSSSLWASPLHMVRKGNGSWWSCGDYCRFNLTTVLDAYPLPNMLNFPARDAGCIVFSKIDLRKKGYYQILMHPDDIQKTAHPSDCSSFATFPLASATLGIHSKG
jgi:hypothetical protein